MNSLLSPPGSGCFPLVSRSPLAWLFLFGHARSPLIISQFFFHLLTSLFPSLASPFSSGSQRAISISSPLLRCETLLFFSPRPSPPLYDVLNYLLLSRFKSFRLRSCRVPFYPPLNAICRDLTPKECQLLCGCLLLRLLGPLPLARFSAFALPCECIPSRLMTRSPYFPSASLSLPESPLAQSFSSSPWILANPLQRTPLPYKTPSPRPPFFGL